MTSPPSQRLLFLGTPDFAVPSLRALAHSQHQVVGVVSQPDRPRGRGRQLESTPVHALADELDLPLLQPEKVGSPDALAWMRARDASLGVVVAFGQFIPKSVRELPPLGLINAHGSLLPRHRGAAPIQHAILAGDTVTGISVMRVVREMDAGPECLHREIPIGPDETSGELFERLADLAALALCEAVDQIALGTARFVEQDHSRATLAPKLDKEFAALHWDQPRSALLRRIRAATPWPGCTLQLRRAERTLKLLQVCGGEAFSSSDPTGGGASHPAPGSVRVRSGRLCVAALDGWIEVLRLQSPGRRPLSAEEYLRGADIQPDEEAITA